MKEKTPTENKNSLHVTETVPSIERAEQKAWQKVLGTRVEVKPLPEIVTPEVKRNLEIFGFGLRYVPALDLGSKSFLQERGVDEYLTELERKYPKWKTLESLTLWSDRELADHTVPRNLEEWYWKLVEKGNVDFPVLPGQWMAVETVKKPSSGEKYTSTPFAERLGFRDDRGNVSWNDAHNAIEREKTGILSDIGLSGRSTDLRFLEALEYNLLGNREGWGKTNTQEWTNTELRKWGASRRFLLGYSDRGGVGYLLHHKPGDSHSSIGFRAAVVLGS
ncbi:MAG: hypothetical protein M3264_04425 [Thermoproteota archaeon]|nr:hypothetical protein [Thermoproteota archaeon]